MLIFFSNYPHLNKRFLLANDLRDKMFSKNVKTKVKALGFIRVCRGSGQIRRKEKCNCAITIAISLLNQSLLSPHPFSCFLRTKKGESDVVFIWFSPYGRFLTVRTASTAPIITITIITAAIPNSTVPVDAKPVTGAAVGGAVGAAGSTVKLVSALDE